MAIEALNVMQLNMKLHFQYRHLRNYICTTINYIFRGSSEGGFVTKVSASIKA